ncbi:MAG: PAS domain S-box protein, partial [Nitrospiraceae bacterium]|nr:PAS domain S-box protein [Nitrospiraceae bacterium]
MADGVFYQSADGALTEVNRAALELFGLTREEFLSRTSYDPGWYVIREDGTEVPPDEHPSMQAFRTGKPVSGVVLGVRNFRSNDIVWLIVNAVPMTGAESGRVEQVFVTLHDISNRRLLEERLRSSEERLALALESVNEGVWDWDLATGSVFRNDRFYTMLGYAPGAIPETYHGWRAFVHPEDISGAENALRQCLSSSSSSSSSLYETEFRMRDAEGAWRWILSRGRVVAWGPDGAPVRMIGTHTDITERKESEKALQQAAHEWRLTFDAVGSGIFLLDTEMKIIRANKAFAALVGGRVDGIAGSCCWELVHAERQPHPDCPMKRMLRTGKPESAEITVGTRRYYATVDPICDDNGVVIGAVHGMRDITERAAMIERLAQNELLLSNAERLAHIGSFQSDAETGAMVWSRELYRILEVPEYLPPLTFEAIAALAHPEDAVQLTQLAGGGAEVRTDVRLTLPSGARKTLRLVAQPLLDEQGRTIGTSGTLMDVTNEARASAELRRNEERLSALLRISSMEYASEQELIEWSLEAVVTLTQSEGGYFHLFDEETQCITLTAWSSAVRRDCSVSADTHYPLARAGVWADSIRNRDVVIHNDYAALREKNALPDGHFPLIRHLGVPVFDGERIVAAAGVANKESPYDESDIRDMLVFLGDAWKIIARRRAEQRLAESESAYRSIFEGSLDGIFRISADGRIERANPAFAHILGHDSPEELIGKPVVDYWDNPHDRSVYLALLLDKKEVRNYPFLLRRSDGAVRHVKVSATMVRNGQNEYIASEGILRDITDQVLMQAQLQHAQKMEAVGRLAGGIAHDFNNILSAISGFASLPLMHGQVSDEERSTLQQILALADKASILTKGLLAFSRKQILSMKDIDLNRILDVSAKLIGRLIGEDIALSVRKADVPLPVLA